MFAIVKLIKLLDDIVYPGIDKEFSLRALKLFKYQALNNSIYKEYLNLVHFDFSKDINISEVPFLPITLFKSQSIKTGDWNEERIFLSSGTTQQERSRHYVKSVDEYLNNSEIGFNKFYGDLKDWTILAYLPGYTENSSSSLIEMMDYFIKLSALNGSGFISFNPEELYKRLTECKLANKKTLLFGVSHALMDFVEQYKIDFPRLTVMETGGMKGLREELTKSDLHSILINGFGINTVHSEYGMTELLSQAYSKGGGIFECTDKMRIIIKDPSDPFEVLPALRSGVINIIDLANEDSCSFIATEDLGKLNLNGSFELLGRLDIADMRGCNLLFYS